MISPTPCSEMQYECMVPDMVQHYQHGHVNVTTRCEEEDPQPVTTSPGQASIHFAQHMSAPSIPCAASEVAAQLGHPMQITKDSDLVDQVLAALQDAGRCEAVISWLQPVVIQLSFSKLGTHVVQEALDKGSTQQQIALIERFHGHITQLVYDFHGNFVLQKAFQVMSGTSQSVKFILDELAPSGQEWSHLVKHKFGCRVTQRVVEHCEPEATQPIVDALAAQAWDCAVDKYANYVMQSVLQNGTADQKYQIVCALSSLGIPNLTQDQIPATVVETAVEHGGDKCVEEVGKAILEWPGAIVRMACDRWGSSVVKRLIGLVDERQKLPEPLYSEAMQQLFAGSETLRRSKKHGRKFARHAEDFQAEAGGA